MSDAYGTSRGTMLRRAFLLLIGCGSAAYSVPRYFSSMDFSAGSRDAAVPTPPRPQSQPQPQPRRIDKAPVAEAPTTETYHAQRGNQFYVTGSVNGNTVRFLVDTGATWVALTQDDAKLLGFNLSTLKWDVRTNTANGIATNAAVTLGDVRLGRIIEYNVPAIIMHQSGISLLGMSFLSRLRSWQISNGVLTIAS
ncbi:MAG TPA: TIGR02281 family clan AA aspartic protease [Stellaceae bacterium]|jgi:aspartyl protease family protein|nr:TIGR02281 family clan AA aspartic protease [Stellaceae bacterium]